MWKNSLYNTVGGLIRLGFGLLSVPLLTRNLGIEKYGLYTTINAILNIALFSEWTIATSITVYLSASISQISSDARPLEKTKNLSIVALYVVMLTLATIILMFYSIPWILIFFEKLDLSQKKVLKEAIQISIWAVCTRLITQFFIGILQANKAFGIINLISTFLTVLSSLLSLYIAFTSKDILMIQKLQLVSFIVALILYFLYCLYLGHLSHADFFRPTLNHFLIFSKYGVRTMVTALGSTLFFQFDRLIILRLFGVGWAGIYSALTTITNQINVVSSMPLQPLLPVLSETYQNIYKAKIVEQILIRAFITNTVLIITLGSGIFFFSSEIVNFLFKSSQFSFFSIRRCLIILTAAYSIYSFNAVGYFTLLAIRHEKYVRNIVIISGVLSLSAIYILSLNFGIVIGCLGNLGYSLTLLLNMKGLKNLNIYSGRLFNTIIRALLLTFFVISASIIFDNLLINIILYLLITSYMIVIFIKQFFSKNA